MVGITIGTTTASAAAAPPILPALVRIAPELPNTVTSRSDDSWPSGRPQRAIWSTSCRKSMVRKPAAVSRKTTHEMPPSRRLTGTL